MERIFSWFCALCSAEYRMSKEYVRTLVLVNATIDPAATAGRHLPYLLPSYWRVRGRGQLRPKVLPPSAKSFVKRDQVDGQRGLALR